ncbi:MAG: ankyrin repeat domain-containing protein [Tatlockia sp.]|nr:ankyrin repeat domain-containing protein [Tatlockia sp.]
MSSHQQIKNLFAAIKVGDLNEVKQILSNQKTPINVLNTLYENKIGDNKIHSFTQPITPLQSACTWGRDDIVEYFLTLGADPTQYDNSGHSPLHYAAFSINKTDNIKRIISLLVKNGIDLNLKSNDNETPLHLAYKHNPVAAMELLQYHDIDVNAKDKHGSTPLHLALSSGSRDRQLIQLGIEKGAEVDARDVYGMTPLLYAINSENLEAIDLLLQNGADPYSVSKEVYITAAYRVKVKYYKDYTNENYKKIDQLFKKHGKTLPVLHGELLDLAEELDYLTLTDQLLRKIIAGGLCFGLTTQSIVDLQDGESGLRKLNDRLNIIGKYSAQELKMRIRDASQIQLDVHKNTIRDPNLVSISEEEVFKIIKTVIHSEFSQLRLNEEEIRDLVNHFLKDKTISGKKEEWSNDDIIRNKISEAVINYKTQKQIQTETKKALKIKYGKEGPLYLEIDIMMQSAAISQRVYRSMHLLEEDMQYPHVRQNILTGFYLIRSKTAEERGLIIPKGGNFIFAGDKKNLEPFFEILHSALEDKAFKNPVSFAIHTEDHAISITYFPKTAKRKSPAWVFYDSNSSLMVVNDYHLVATLMEASFSEGEKLNVAMQIFSSKEDANLLQESLNNLNSQPKWINFQKVTADNAAIVRDLAKSISYPEKVEEAQKLASASSNLYSELENWRPLIYLTFGTFLVGIGAAGAVFASPFLAILSVAGCYGIYESWNSYRLPPATNINISKAQEKLEKAIHEKQGPLPSEASHNKILDVLDKNKVQLNKDKIISQSYSVKKHRKADFQSAFKNQLVDFFREENKDNKEEIKFSNHGKWMYEELTKTDKKLDYTVEAILSRTISHALDAKYYQSTASFFLRSDKVDKMYNSVVNLIDIEATIKKLENRIDALNNKVYGPFAGTTINMNDKDLTVSSKVAEVHQLIQKMKDPGYTDRHVFLAEMLHLASQESSFFTTKKSFAIRHKDVWNFFETLKDSLVVKDNSSLKLVNTSGKKEEKNISTESEIAEKDSEFTPKTKRFM